MLETTLTNDTHITEASYARQAEDAAPLTLPVAVLKALSPLIDCHEARSALRGILIEKSGWAVATNGKALGAVHLPSLDGWLESGCTLPKQDIQLRRVDAIVKAAGRANKVNIDAMTAAGIGVIVADSDLEPFPNWRSIIPAKPDGNPKAADISTNVRLFSQFTQLADLVGIEERSNLRRSLIKASYLTVFCKAEAPASLITFNNAALGVICHTRSQALPPKGLSELYGKL